MKTNIIMNRPMGMFNVEQRTSDGYFEANSLLQQWNSSNKRRKMSEYLGSEKTKEFIKEINYREAHVENQTRDDNAQLPKRTTADYQPLIKIKGRNSKNGRIPDRIWMSPLLFIDFAMWINPSFKYDVLKFVYDQLIEYRHSAGDNYNILTTSIAKLIDCDYVKVAKAIQWIVFNKTDKELRQHANQSQLKEISDIEKKIAFMIDMNFVNSHAQLMNALRKMYSDKYSKF